MAYSTPVILCTPLEHEPVDFDVAISSARATSVALAGTLLLAAAVGIGRFGYTPLLPTMRETLGWTVSQAGDVASANFLGYMAGALAASALAQRPARWLWLCAGMILSAITTSGGAVVVAFPAWVGLRFCAGVASALCLVLGTAVVLDCLDRHAQAHLGALHFAGVGGGIVASVLTIELARRAGWSVFGQWGALGSTAIALLAGAWLIMRALPPRGGTGERRISQASQGPVPTARVLTKLIAAYGLFGFGYVVTATFIVTIARRLDHAALVETLIWTVVGVLAAPSVLVWQRLAQHLGMVPALRLAYRIEAAGVLLAGYDSGHGTVMLGGALLGGTFMGITALGLSAARQAAGSNQESAMGWMTAAFGLGQFLGPAVAGRLAQMTQGFVVPSMVAALLLLVGMVLLRGVEVRRE
jgi:predicted MFS family arabinose efflux permease